MATANQERLRIVVGPGKSWYDRSIMPLDRQTPPGGRRGESHEGRPAAPNTGDVLVSDDNAYGIAAGELREFIEQYENLDGEKRQRNEDQKEILAEAKASGFTPKVVKMVMKLQSQGRDVLDEEQALIEQYMGDLGMTYEKASLGNGGQPTDGRLRQIIDRYQHVEAEKKDVVERMKEVMAEAKARGYDTKVMKKVIALRKRDKDDVAEEEAILEMYKAALGMV